MNIKLSHTTRVYISMETSHVHGNLNFVLLPWQSQWGHQQPGRPVWDWVYGLVWGVASWLSYDNNFNGSNEVFHLLSVMMKQQ